VVINLVGHDRQLLNIGVESRAVRLRAEGARMLSDAARWLVVPVMLAFAALTAQAAVAGVDYFGRNYPQVAKEVPEGSPLGIFFVVLSVALLIAALFLAARLAQLLVERIALRHYRRALALLAATDAPALIASGGLWDALSSAFSSVQSRRYIGSRPVRLERQLALAAAYLQVAGERCWADNPRLPGCITHGARLWLAQSPPLRRASALSGWLLVGFGLPLCVSLSFAHPPLAVAAALSFAALGIVQVATYAEYCGNLAALCDFFRGETEAKPRIWH
jgi:hypothetical protein